MEKENKVTETTIEKPEIDAIYDWDRIDRWSVSKEIVNTYPEMHFVWIARNEDRISMKEGMGYEVVHISQTQIKRRGRPSKNGDNSVDDTIIRADCILMMIPKKVYESRQNAKEQKLKAMTVAPREQLEDKAKEVSNTIGRNVIAGGKIISQIGT